VFARHNVVLAEFLTWPFWEFKWINKCEWAAEEMARHRWWQERVGVQAGTRGEGDDGR